ncbi:MAG: histidine phosphatase [Alphaproteobacteria bacterium]|nr:MAG: histidine phosphatase [Alphaproteobacteria bacterium]
MAEIYLVRHGQASFNSENYDRLSDLGHQQSAYLGVYFALRNITFDHIFTGTQLRHSQTAKDILMAQPYTISPIRQEGLNEYDFKALYEAYMAQHPHEAAASPKQDRRIFYQRLKKALKLWSENRLAGDLPESWENFKTRVTDALSHIQKNISGKCLVVSSGGAISMALGQILDLKAQKIIDLNLQIKNSSFSHIYLGHDRMHLSSFNNIPHLDRQDRLDAITFS